MNRILTYRRLPFPSCHSDPRDKYNTYTPKITSQQIQRRHSAESRGTEKGLVRREKNQILSAKTTWDRDIWDTTRMLTVVMVDKLDVCIEGGGTFGTGCQGGRPKDGRVRKEVCVYSMGLDWLQVSTVKQSLEPSR